jgi:hypothetical protein
MAHARAKMRDRYLEEARDHFARMGIEPTPEQLASAGENLLLAAQRDRLNIARVTRWTAHKDEKRAADVEWATDQAHKYADVAHAFDPTIPDWDVFRVCLMAVADELGAPDGFSRPRLIKRLAAYVKSVQADADARSAKLSANLPDLDLSDG